VHRIPPGGRGPRTRRNRELKRRHVTRGTVRQVLVYDGERCVGWCQFGPPGEVATIKNPKAYERDLAELPDWRIGCIFTNAKDRGKGVAAAAVAAALQEIKRAGGGVVEAYPEQTLQRPPQRGAYLHTGSEELYARYGFTRVRKIAKWRWVMRTTN
jgi:GNAT superfamily N-acetyltransferase